MPLKGARRFHAGEGLPSPFQAPREGRRELVAFTDLPQGIDDPADLNKSPRGGAGAARAMPGHPVGPPVVPIAPRFRPMPPITAPRTESSRGRATSSAAFLLLGLVALGRAAAHSRAPSLDIDMFPILDIYSYSWIYLLLLDISLTLRSTGAESPRAHPRLRNEHQHINFRKRR